MAVIIYQPEPTDDPIVYGPFASGDDACKWAYGKFTTAHDWYWVPLHAPYAV